MNILKIVVVVLLVCLVGTLIILSTYQCPKPVSITSQEAGSVAITYLNKYFTKNTTATLGSVTEENGLYHLKITIGGQQFDSYMTLDGKLFFPSALDTTKAPVV